MAQYSIVVSDPSDVSQFSGTSGVVDYNDTFYDFPVVWNPYSTGFLRYGTFASSKLDVVLRWAMTGFGSAFTRDGGPALMLQDGSTDCQITTVSESRKIAKYVGGVLSYTNLGSTHNATGVASFLMYSRIQADSTAGTWRYKEWNGALADEPASWLIDASGLEYTFASGGVGLAWRALLTGDGLKARIAEVYAGTDGDPAPTGPVGGTRRRSPLLLTPW